ncbi:MAG: hypothetical protein CMA27_06965 [Euryarchaeota archaeon]|nr:hypothetical protein [Euryarchaeota archaeon]
MNNFQDNTDLNPFYTFDTFDCEGILELLTVLETTDEDFTQFLSDNPITVKRILEQGIENPIKRKDIPWDDANLIFIVSKSLESKMHPPLGKGKSKERLGRVPLGEGNPISYLLMYLIPPNNEEGEVLLKLISQLHSGFSKSIHGHEKFSKGKWGMSLHGYLLSEDVVKLHKLLKSVKWTVSANEPLDGGVRTFANDLSIILRDATKQKTGVLMRSHN